MGIFACLGQQQQQKVQYSCDCLSWPLGSIAFSDYYAHGEGLAGWGKLCPTVLEKVKVSFHIYKTPYYNIWIEVVLSYLQLSLTNIFDARLNLNKVQLN